MVKIIVFLFLVITSATVIAQPITKTDLKIIQKKQDSLGILGWRIANENNPVARFVSDSAFTKILVRALKVKNSFYFAFDSVQIAKITAPDSSFRIFTWELKINNNRYIQRGLIQYKTIDGNLRLTPLFDKSELEEGFNEIRTADKWTGALYYNILMNEYEGKKYYTLFGFDNNNSESNKKWMEILTFDGKNNPVFGAPIIKHKTKGTLNRLMIEYKKEARLKLNWDEEQKMIIFDHTSSENGFVNQRKTYVPDGDYEGLKWDNGFWVHEEKVMCNCPLSNKETKEQINKPAFDAMGNRIDNVPPPVPSTVPKPKKKN